MVMTKKSSEFMIKVEKKQKLLKSLMLLLYFMVYRARGGGGAGTIIFLILETFSIYLGRENTLKCFSSIG